MQSLLLTRATETLLVIDETHTLCSGPGGYTRAHGLEPDLLTVGKAIGSGIPSAAYGFSAEVADRVEAAIGRELSQPYPCRNVSTVADGSSPAVQYSWLRGLVLIKLLALDRRTCVRVEQTFP